MSNIWEEKKMEKETEPKYETPGQTQECSSQKARKPKVLRRKSSGKQALFSRAQCLAGEG